jgi:hypothetical protein
MMPMSRKLRHFVKFEALRSRVMGMRNLMLWMEVPYAQRAAWSRALTPVMPAAGGGGGGELRRGARGRWRGAEENHLADTMVE